MSSKDLVQRLAEDGHSLSVTGKIAKTVKIASQGKAPTSELLGTLKQHKQAIIQYLEASAMTEAIEAIERVSIGLDFDKVDPRRRHELAHMPLENTGDVTNWKNAWLAEIGETKRVKHVR